MRQFSLTSILFFYSTFLFSQGLCDDKNAEKGDFVFDGPSAGCTPFTFKIKDQSGGTDVKYILDYQGEAASRLASLNPTTALQNTLSNLSNRQVSYTILQYGKKNGKAMYACKLVTVRPDNEPLFSYTNCNNQLIEIIIPKNDLVNNFDYYKVNWGDGNPDERVEPNQLPYKKSKNLSSPRVIKLEGFYNSPNGCAAPNSITVPQLTSAPRQVPNHPNIDKVELKQATQATLTIRGSYESDGYSLFMTPSGSAYPSEPYKKNVIPGNLVVDIPDSTKSYCFYLVRSNPCIEQSAEICTNPIIDYKALERQNTLAWLNYPTQMTGIPNTTTFGRFLTSRTTIIKQESGITVALIPATSTSLTDPIDCTKEYCYQLKTETQGQLYYYSFKGESLSPKICLDRKDIHPPAITQTVASVNAANQSQISFTDNSAWTLRKDKYRLLRKENNVFKSVDSSATLRDLIDKVDASSNSYCYKLDYTDECKSTSLLSPEFCTIHLAENPANSLLWTNKTPFGNASITVFEVEYADEVSGNFMKETDKNASEVSHEAQLDKFEEEAKYRIKTSIGGRVSYSNIITIPIKANIFVPEAFSPNNDSYNQELQVFGNLRRAVEFSMKIYNRWGNPIFSSTDPNFLWDGTYQGKESPSDMYSYTVFAKLSDGQEIKKVGKFLLLR